MALACNQDNQGHAYFAGKRFYFGCGGGTATGTSCVRKGFGAECMLNSSTLMFAASNQTGRKFEMFLRCSLDV